MTNYPGDRISMREEVKPIRVLCCSAIVGDSSRCCDSCHDEDESGYADMPEISPDGLYDINDPRSGMWQAVCCGTTGYLENMTKQQRRVLWDEAWQKEGQFWYKKQKGNA